MSMGGLRWTQASRTAFTLKIPGTLGLRARIETHSETISARILVNGQVVRNWCVQRSTESVDGVQRDIEAMLMELADGIRGTNHEEGEA